MRKIALLLCSALVLLGCSGEERLVLPEATLVGSVTFKGKPVPHALVIVTGTGPGAQGYADKDGKFEVKNCPAGDVKIGVNTDAGKGNQMGAMMASKMSGDGAAKPTFVDVPKKYFDPNTSGIQTKVNDPKGTNTYDIKIE